MNTIESLAARVSAQDTLIRDLSEQLARLRETFARSDATGHAVRTEQFTCPDADAQYIVIETSTYGGLQDAVTLHLRSQRGWRLQGGVSTLRHESGVTHYAQAMVRGFA